METNTSQATWKSTCYDLIEYRSDSGILSLTPDLWCVFSSFLHSRAKALALLQVASREFYHLVWSHLVRSFHFNGHFPSLEKHCRKNPKNITSVSFTSPRGFGSWKPLLRLCNLRHLNVFWSPPVLALPFFERNSLNKKFVKLLSLLPAFDLYTLGLDINFFPQDLRYISSMSSLTSLYLKFSFNELNKEDLLNFEQITRIKQLRLLSHDFPLSVLNPWISRCTNLQEITLDGFLCQEDDTLLHLTKLTKAIIGGAYFGHCYTHLTSLDFLIMPDGPIPDGLKNLTHLDCRFSGVSMKKPRLIAIGNLTKLRHLDITSNRGGCLSDELPYLSTLTNLVSLKTFVDELGNAQWPLFSNLQALSIIMRHNPRVPPEYWHGFHLLHQIQSLEIHPIPDSQTMRVIGTLTTLTQLRFPAKGNADLHGLEGLKHLTSLTAPSSDITPVCSLSSLKTLAIDETSPPTKVFKSEIEHISNLTNLENLSLFRCVGNNAHLLAKLYNLQVLNLKPFDGDHRYLVYVYKHLTKLQSLDLSNVTTERVLLDILRHPFLKTLCVGPGVTLEGFKKLRKCHVESLHVDLAGVWSIEGALKILARFEGLKRLSLKHWRGRKEKLRILERSKSLSDVKVDVLLRSKKWVLKRVRFQGLQ